MENRMNGTKIRLYWWVFLVGMCSLGITYQINMSHKPHKALPVVITKPIAYVVKMETIVSKKETHDLCLKDAKCNLLAEAIVYEARGEPTKGQIAVAQVILNRKQDPRWPDKVVDVIKQPHQFSYLKDKHKQRPPSQDDWNKARKIAHAVIIGTERNPVGDATHYHATRVQPKWAKKLQPVAKIGNHIFYK